MLEMPETKEEGFGQFISEWNKIPGIKKTINSKKNKKLNVIKRNILKLKKKITSKDILDSIKIFSEIQDAGNNKIFDLDIKFITLNNFLHVDYDEFEEMNYNNRLDYIGLNSESLCLDCLSGDINKYKKGKKSKFKKVQGSSSTSVVANENFNDKYFQLISKEVGDYNWKLQRTSELLSQVYLEYLQNKDVFSFNNSDEYYLDNLLQTSKLFLKFIEYKDSKIHISKLKPYYYISERPFKLFPVLRRFLEETYPDGNFVLPWMKSAVFRKQLIKFLKDNNYYGELGNVRFSRKEYRKIAKKTNRLYFGNIVDTNEFKKFVKKQDRSDSSEDNEINEDNETESQFNFKGFSRSEIKEVLSRQQYDELYGSSTATELYSRIKKSKNRSSSFSAAKERERAIIRYNWEKIVKNGVDTRVFAPCHYTWQGKII